LLMVSLQVLQVAPEINCFDDPVALVSRAGAASRMNALSLF